MKVNDNGTVRMKVGPVIDTYNIWRITPFIQATDQGHGGECNMRTSKRQRKQAKHTELS